MYLHVVHKDILSCTFMLCTRTSLPVPSCCAQGHPYLYLHIVHKDILTCTFILCTRKSLPVPSYSAQGHPFLYLHIVHKDILTCAFILCTRTSIPVPSVTHISLSILLSNTFSPCWLKTSISDYRNFIVENVGSLL